ncbi:MAG: Transcription_WhiB, partial [uncultured Actinomycetospora sp.]
EGRPVGAGHDHRGRAGMAGARAVRADRSGGVLPREGREHPGGQADLQQLRRPHRVPRVRARARRALRDLGRALRARAPSPQAPGGL